MWPLNWIRGLEWAEMQSVLMQMSCHGEMFVLPHYQVFLIPPMMQNVEAPRKYLHGCGAVAAARAACAELSLRACGMWDLARIVAAWTHLFNSQQVMDYSSH